MTLREVQEADMAYIIETDGQRFQWNGGDYGCVAGDLTKTKPLQDGGFMQEFDLVITTTVSQFSELPAEGQHITISTGVTGGTYRIERTRQNFQGTLLAMDLISVNK